MQIVCIWDNLHESLNLLVFWEKLEKYFKLSFADIFTQSAKRWTMRTEKRMSNRIIWKPLLNDKYGFFYFNTFHIWAGAQHFP